MPISIDQVINHMHFQHFEDDPILIKFHYFLSSAARTNYSSSHPGMVKAQEILEHHHLDSQYYCKTNTLGDGNCLWHAFVDQFSDPEIKRTVRKDVRDIPPNADVYRQNVVEFARENQNNFLTDDGNVDDMVKNLLCQPLYADPLFALAINI